MGQRKEMMGSPGPDSRPRLIRQTQHLTMLAQGEKAHLVSLGEAGRAVSLAHQHQAATILTTCPKPQVTSPTPVLLQPAGSSFRRMITTAPSSSAAQGSVSTSAPPPNKQKP